jgi:SRSO17 transposase
MDAKQVKQLKPMLNKYLRQFDDCFGRIEPTERLKAYVTGQLSDLQRKSIEPMADAVSLPPRNLQQFLSLHKWDEMRMRDILEQIVAGDHQHPCSIGIFDETGHPKKGDKTPGVQRQWCGSTGKKDNCVVTVHLNTPLEISTAFWMANCSCPKVGLMIRCVVRQREYRNK